MKFGSLEYLYLVWILPVMILLAVYSFRKKDLLLRRGRRPESLGPAHAGGAPPAAGVRSSCLFLAAVRASAAHGLPQAAVGFSLGGGAAQGGGHSGRGRTSPESMLAEDIKPNRLERAKREITDLVDMLQGDRLGLVALQEPPFWSVL